MKTSSPVFILTLLFLILKLTNYITWSWLWVLAPLWLPITIYAVWMFFLGAIFLVMLATHGNRQ